LENDEMSRKKIYPIRDLSKDTKKLYDVLNDANNDLSCVLIGTSFLDETLRSILQQYLVKCNTARNMLNPNGSLGTFSNRCDLTYCLALINKRRYKDLRIIQDIRNLFSHSHFEKSFGDNDIITLIDKLTDYHILKETGMFIEIEVENPTLKQIHDSSLGRFKLTIVLLSQELLLTGLSLKHKGIKN
jgi:DNA-binding MltR family transcriptional regulator